MASYEKGGGKSSGGKGGKGKGKGKGHSRYSPEQHAALRALPLWTCSICHIEDNWGSRLECRSCRTTAPGKVVDRHRQATSCPTPLQERQDRVKAVGGAGGGKGGGKGGPGQSKGQTPQPLDSAQWPLPSAIPQTKRKRWNQEAPAARAPGVSHETPKGGGAQKSADITSVEMLEQEVERCTQAFGPDDAVTVAYKSKLEKAKTASTGGSEEPPQTEVYTAWV